METKTRKENEKKMKRDGQPRTCAFGWQNFALTAVALTFIVAGFLLMLPPVDIRNTVGGRYAPTPGPGAYDARRIRAAPLLSFIGFVIAIPAVMYVPKAPRKDEEKESEV